MGSNVASISMANYTGEARQIQGFNLPHIPVAVDKLELLQNVCMLSTCRSDSPSNRQLYSPKQTSGICNKGTA